MRGNGSGKRNVTRDGTLNEYPTWSPDGRRLAFGSHRDGPFEIYTIPARGGRARNLTRHRAHDKWPAWSPDGKWIAFVSHRYGSEDVFVRRPDGTGVRRITRTRQLEESHPAWLPDGRLTYTSHANTGPIELWAV